MPSTSCPHCHQIVHTLDGSCPECEGWTADELDLPDWWERFDPILDLVVWVSIGFCVVYFGWHVARAVLRAVTG